MAHSRMIMLSVLITLVAACSIFSTSCLPDKCAIVCYNGGTCKSNQCICPVSFTGSNCQNVTLLNNWVGTDNNVTTSSSYQQQISIARSTTDTSQVVIAFTSGFAAGHVVNGTLSTDGGIITYTKQLIPTTTTPDTVSGTIVLLSTNSLSNNYTYNNSHDGMIYTIQGHYTK